MSGELRVDGGQLTVESGELRVLEMEMEDKRKAVTVGYMDR